MTDHCFYVEPVKAADIKVGDEVLAGNIVSRVVDDKAQHHQGAATIWLGDFSDPECAETFDAQGVWRVVSPSPVDTRIMGVLRYYADAGSYNDDWAPVYENVGPPEGWVGEGYEPRTELDEGKAARQLLADLESPPVDGAGPFAAVAVLGPERALREEAQREAIRHRQRADDLEEQVAAAPPVDAAGRCGELLHAIKVIVDEPLDERARMQSGPTRKHQFARIEALVRDLPALYAPPVGVDEDAREWVAVGEQKGAAREGETMWAGPYLKPGERVVVVPKSRLASPAAPGVTEAAREALLALAAICHGDVPERHAPEVWAQVIKAHDLLLAALAVVLTPRSAAPSPAPPDNTRWQGLTAEQAITELEEAWKEWAKDPVCQEGHAEQRIRIQLHGGI